MSALIATGTNPASWAALGARLTRATDGRSFDDPLFGEWLDACLEKGGGPGFSSIDAPALLARWLGDVDAFAVGQDVRACSAVESIDRDVAAARYLVFAESPVDALRAWLESGHTGTAADMLRRWVDSARAILRLVQSHGARCLVVNAAEARNHPSALADGVNDWLGQEQISLSDPSPVVPENDDPIARAIAVLVVQADATARQLWEQLYACTYPLVGEDQPQDEAEFLFDLNALIDAEALLARFREIQRLRDELNRELSIARTEASEDVKRLQAELGRTREEGEQLLLQLHQAQEELESLYLARRQNDAGKDRAVGDASGPAKAAKPVESAPVPLGQSDARTTGNRQPAIQPEPKELEKENELLVLQLHQVQEELEFYFLENRKLQAGVARAVPVGVEIAIGVMEIGTIHDRPPHRGLDLVLRNVRSVQRSLDSLHVRLVEHYGRPGLAVFAPERGDPSPFSTWIDTGSENSQAFMLIVPSDGNCGDLLKRMPRTDWDLLSGVAREIAVRLRVSTRPGMAEWASVSQRLLHQLNELPPRLRYDNLAVELSMRDGEQLICVSFQQALFGERRFGNIELNWQPGNRPYLELTVPSGEYMPPLSNWPTSDDGRPAKTWRIPVGHAGSRKEKSHAWASLGSGDRGFLLALIDALPAVPPRFASAASSGIDARLLNLQARRAMQEAHRHHNGLTRIAVERILALFRK